MALRGYGGTDLQGPYLFDMLGTADPRREAEVEQALVANVESSCWCSRRCDPQTFGTALCVQAGAVQAIMAGAV